MQFEIDKQTAADLELFEKTNGEKSVFSLFNHTNTIGGRECLRKMFQTPLNKKELIEERMESVQFFADHSFGFTLNKEGLHFIEHYLSRGNKPIKFSVFNTYLKKWFFKRDTNEQFIIQRGIRYLISVISNSYFFFKNFDSVSDCKFINEAQSTIVNLIENSFLKLVLDYKNRVRLFHFEYSKFDYYFRTAELSKVREILDIFYHIDAYKSIYTAMHKSGFTLPQITDKCNSILIRGLFHPFLENPVDNDFEMDENRNICFLTGPNMAGKSTFLKSLGISIYLAHIGFPVPAKYMQTSVYNGLFTTINLSDNITKGYSHFYSEVLRVKYVAERISQHRSVVVVFDELFRGTNVKDAYEASLSVIQAFSKLNKGAFAISTHIIEIAEKLNIENVFYKCFEANLINEVPHYSYKLKHGISDERIGMYILKKENVIESIVKATEQK